MCSTGVHLQQIVKLKQQIKTLEKEAHENAEDSKMAMELEAELKDAKLQLHEKNAEKEGLGEFARPLTSVLNTTSIYINNVLRFLTDKQVADAETTLTTLERRVETLALRAKTTARRNRKREKLAEDENETDPARGNTSNGNATIEG